MDHFAGLDVSVRVTSVCIVDDDKIVREVKVASELEAIAQMMRVGLYRPVHVKTLRSQKLRMLLTRRKLLHRRRERSARYFACSRRSRVSGGLC